MDRSLDEILASSNRVRLAHPLPEGAPALLLRPHTNPASNYRRTAAADLAVAKVEVTSSAAESLGMTILAMVSERYAKHGPFS